MRFPYLVIAMGCTLAAAPAAAQLHDELAAVWPLAATRSEATVTSLGTSPLKWPTVGNGAVWNTAKATNPTADWRAGFWPGTLWLLAQRTADPVWLQRAKDWSAPLALSTNGDHDIGFITIASLGKQLLCNDDITDPSGADRAAARTAILRGANNLNLRFNMAGVPAGMTRSWNDIEGEYPVCIDNMMNLEVLLLAYELDNTKTEYFANALAHARSTIAKHLRADGSTYHVVRHFQTLGDPRRGEVERKNTRQGYSDETTWSRGQAWAVYGFAMMHRYASRNGDTSGDFLAAAEATADYFLSRLPHYYESDSWNFHLGDFVPPSDFDAGLGEPTGPWCDADNDGVPNEENGTGTVQHSIQVGMVTYFNDRAVALEQFTSRDSSAAAIVCSALFELSILCADPEKRSAYRTAAETILNCLISYDGADPDTDPDYLCPVGDTANPGILRLGSEAWNTPNRSLIYGDYYFLEAIARYEALTARELLDATQRIAAGPGGLEFSFERHDPAPALMFRIQRASSLDGVWTTVSHRTGAGAWGGTISVSEEPLPGGTARVRVTEPLPAPGGKVFYRVVTFSAGGI